MVPALADKTGLATGWWCRCTNPPDEPDPKAEKGPRPAGTELSLELSHVPTARITASQERNTAGDNCLMEIQYSGKK